MFFLPFVVSEARPERVPFRRRDPFTGHFVSNGGHRGAGTKEGASWKRVVKRRAKKGYR